jgi:hypothetical protein
LYLVAKVAMATEFKISDLLNDDNLCFVIQELIQFLQAAFIKLTLPLSTNELIQLLGESLEKKEEVQFLLF